MELAEVGKALRRSWWLLVVGALSLSLASLTMGLIQTPLYSSHTQLFVSATASASNVDAYQGSQFSEQRVTSYVQLLQGEELASRVVSRLDLSLTPTELANRVTASAITDTVILNVAVTDSDASRAQDIAAALGIEFSDMVVDLETPTGAAISPVKVTIVNQAELPASPSSPNIARNGILGAIIGLLLGCLGAVMRSQLDRTVRDPEEASSLAGIPLLGLLVHDAELAESHVVDRQSSTPIAEGYRQLRTNLQFLNVDEPPRVIMVSSAVPSEGKTTLAVNLALTLAETGRSVVLVEADLRRPRVTRYLQMIGGVGLTNVLSGSAEPADVVQLHAAGPSVIASGPIPPNPGELLASTRMFSLLEDLRQKYDFVILDTPPLLPVADSSTLAVLADGILLSVRYGQTTKQQLKQTRLTLERIGARSLGFVLNIVPARTDITKHHGYGYDYSAEA